MTKKAWLSQPGELSRRITYHTERLQRLRREADAVASRWGEGSSVRGGEAPYVRMLERIEAQEEQLEREYNLYDRLRAQIEEAVSRLPLEKMRLVLLYHYLEGKSFLQVGELLYMDKGTAHRWASRALDALELPEDPIDIFSEDCNECLSLPTDTTPGGVL